MENMQGGTSGRQSVAQQLVTLSRMCAVLCISRSTAYRRKNSRGRYFDPDFPKGVSLGVRTIRYPTAEIERYLKCKKL